VVRTAVVHEHDLERLPAENGVEPVDQNRKRSLAVVDGDYDGNANRRSLGFDSFILQRERWSR